MPQFEVNLIREHVVPLDRRRVYLKVMLAYLLLCGVGLVIVFSQATRDYIVTSRQKADIQRLEQEFRDQHPQQDDILDYASLLKMNMKNLSDAIGEVGDDIGERVDLARMLVGLSAPLPVESIIVDVRLAMDKATMSFEVAMPIGENTVRMPNASELTEVWEEDPELMSQLKSLSAVASRRRLVAGAPYFVIKFSGELAKKAS